MVPLAPTPGRSRPHHAWSQMLGRADPGQHQQLRRVERAAGEDDFTPRRSSGFHPRRFRRRPFCLARPAPASGARSIARLARPRADRDRRARCAARAPADGRRRGQARAGVAKSTEAGSRAPAGATICSRAGHAGKQVSGPDPPWSRPRRTAVSERLNRGTSAWPGGAAGAPGVIPGRRRGSTSCR